MKQRSLERAVGIRTARTSSALAGKDPEHLSIEITAVHATEILDSRGRPTLSVTLRTADGATHRAGVPSGASTGSGEAVELRDGDAARYGGKGTRTAVGNVTGPISEALAGRSFTDLAAWTMR